uniref:DUF3825 domain-containing protein n=1 Tax=Schlesneria paludicola TaxID=360056 RepID=A0A7C4LR06_9PLAN
MPWPADLYELVFMPHTNEKLDELAGMAEPEEWDYRRTTTDHHKPILFNYLRYTYRRLAEEDKIVVADDGSAVAFNTGLVTPAQEPIFCYCTQNRLPDRPQSWHFHAWRRQGEYDLTRFSALPDMAHYFDDPSGLVLDTRKELRVNVEHVISENRERFPEPYSTMPEYQLQTFLKGAIDNAKQRVRRNYKTAIPQYYRGRIQLLLPLCLTAPDAADLALVVDNHDTFYRAATCLTLDMAYNNARQLARPDREWLVP